MYAELILENLESVEFPLTDGNSVGLFDISKTKLFADGDVFEQTCVNGVLISIHCKDSLKLKPVSKDDEEGDGNSAWKRLCDFHDVTGIYVTNNVGEKELYYVPYSDGRDFDPNEYMETFEDGNACFIVISKDKEWRKKIKEM